MKAVSGRWSHRGGDITIRLERISGFGIDTAEIRQRIRVKGRFEDFFDTTDEELFDISPLYSEIEKDDSDFQKAVETLEKRLILHSLEKNKWNRTKTAMMLGLPRKTLFRKMKKYGLT
ncbi:MAG: helix-turn-helix domain-containing protein [bacterium]